MTFADLVEILGRAIGADAAKTAAEAICREAAGESVHIPRRPGRPEILPTDTTATVRARLGVPERTARRWVTQWRQ